MKKLILLSVLAFVFSFTFGLYPNNAKAEDVEYEGIKGNLSFDGYYVTPYNKETQGDAVINVKGTYTLPK